MHRTTADGAVDEGGKSMSVDQALPGTPGSTVSAEHINAIQEELCNLIVALGGTVNTSPAADRTDGWDQISTLLMAGTNLPVSLTKLTDGTTSISQTIGDITVTLTLQKDLITYTRVDTSGSPDITWTATLQSQSMSLGYKEDTTTTKSVSINSEGVSYLNSNSRMLHTKVDFSSASWVSIGGGNYQANVVTTDIPNTSTPLAALLKYRFISQTNTTIRSSVDVGFLPQAGGGFSVSVTVPLDLGNGSYDQHAVTVFYEL
jgi:hypothetical protein